MLGDNPRRQFYEPDEGGRLPFASQGMDIVGPNAPFTGSRLDGFKQGGAVMRFFNSVPGINAIGGVDDYLQNRISNYIGNFSYGLLPITVPTALYVTVPALLEPAPSILHLLH